jgi:hypothetical protein
MRPLAAQVAHVIFISKYWNELPFTMTPPQRIGAKSGALWKKHTEEWDALNHKLKDTYHRIDRLFRENLVWNDDSIGGAMAIVVHCLSPRRDPSGVCVLKNEYEDELKLAGQTLAPYASAVLAICPASVAK